MRRFISSITLVTTILLPFSAQALEAEKIAEGLMAPWGLAYIDANHMLITERGGTIKRLDLRSNEHTVIANVPNVWASGQGGLLDVALSPFDQHLIYFTYSKDIDGEGATTLASARFQNGKVSQWQDVFVSSSRSDTGRHFGSRVTFDSNSLYLSIGDRGVRENAQNTLNHAGTIVRLTPDGDTPIDNPFIHNDTVLDQIWSYGHRNPQGLFYDQDTKALWSIEHGPRGGDEINLIKKGQNYGWPITSHGKEYWGPIRVGEAKEKEGIISPVKVYVPSIAPSSLILYRGSKYPELTGKLLASALKLTHINVITLNEQNEAVSEQRLFSELNERIRDIETSPQGDIYFVTDQGNLYKIKYHSISY